MLHVPVDESYNFATNTANDYQVGHFINKNEKKVEKARVEEKLFLKTFFSS